MCESFSTHLLLLRKSDHEIFLFNLHDISSTLSLIRRKLMQVPSNSFIIHLGNSLVYFFPLSHLFDQLYIWWALSGVSSFCPICLTSLINLICLFEFILSKGKQKQAFQRQTLGAGPASLCLHTCQILVLSLFAFIISSQFILRPFDSLLLTYRVHQIALPTLRIHHFTRDMLRIGEYCFIKW